MLVELFIQSAADRYAVCKSFARTFRSYRVVKVLPHVVIIRVKTCFSTLDADDVMRHAGLSADALDYFCVNSENLAWSSQFLPDDTSIADLPL